MTKAQKDNQARFKKVQAEAKKLKAKNPRLKHTDAVKQAWAIILPGSGKKKAPVKKAPVKKKIGAVKKKASIAGVFKFAGAGFQDTRQFDIYGDLSYIIDDKFGQKITEITANPKNNDLAFKKIRAHILRLGNNPFDDKGLDTKIKKFVKQLQTEALEYNKGKKTTAKPAKQFISPTVAKAPGKKKAPTKKSPAKKTASKRTLRPAGYQYGRSEREYDMRKQALKPGKRISKETGKAYYEYRANRSDKGVLTGVKKKTPAKSYHKDTGSHNVSIRVMSGINNVKKSVLQEIAQCQKDLINYNNSVELWKPYLKSKIVSVKSNAKKHIEEFKKHAKFKKQQISQLKKLI